MTAAEWEAHYHRIMAARDEQEAIYLKQLGEAWQERDEARASIESALKLLEEAGCGCHGEPIPTAMRVLSLALKEQD
jgi:hypothetical protein